MIGQPGINCCAILDNLEINLGQPRDYWTGIAL
jgi:hypothetical protein